MLVVLGRVCLTIVCLLCWSGLASAQSELTAQDWFERGAAFSRVGQWSDAREAYLTSLRLEQRVSTHFNLATVSLQLQLGRATLLALDDFAQLADPRIHAEYLAEAARLRAGALDLTGTVVLEVEPDNATVEVDREARAWPVGAQLRISLDEGHHVLLLRAPQHLDSTLEVDVTRGVTAQLAATLNKVPTAEPVLPATPVTDVHEKKGVWREVLLWGGVAALGIGALTTVLVLTLQRDKPPASGGSLNKVF